MTKAMFSICGFIGFDILFASYRNAHTRRALPSGHEEVSVFLQRPMTARRRVLANVIAANARNTIQVSLNKMGKQLRYKPES